MKSLILSVLLFVSGSIVYIRCEAPDSSEYIRSFPDSIVSTEYGPSPLSVAWYDTLRRNETLGMILSRHDVSPQRGYEILRALRERMDLRRCPPGVAVTAYGDSMSIHRITFQVKTDIISTGFIGDSIHVQQLPVSPYRRIAFVRGTISGNLYESMSRNGCSPALILRFADIFAWEVDFLTEVRNGDEFALVFEETIDSRFTDDCDIQAAWYRGARGERYAIRFTPSGSRAAYFNEDGESVVRTFLRSPLNFSRISSGFSFSRMHPILRIPRPHLGVDYAAPTGTPVVSIADGTVISAGWRNGFGKTVLIRHAGSCETQYAHLSRYGRGIRKGSAVVQGQIIGYVGSTGLSTGPHLDFRFRKAGRWVNPLTFESPRAEPIPDSDIADYTDMASDYITVLRGFPMQWANHAIRGGRIHLSD